jgi:Zn-dependent protease with chaperone function
MRAWEQWAAGLGRAWLDARTQVADGARTVVDAWTDPRSVHEQLVDEFVVDATWAQERATHVAGRLNALRDGPPLEPVVLWASGLQAFTLPGSRVYLTRELMEQLPGEGAVAFVLGHEMAHHDLGHLSVDPAVAAALPDVPLALDVALVAKHALLVWARPEWELAADERGAVLAMGAGYALDDCLAALRTLERWALDHRRLAAVFGREPGEGPLAEWWRQRTSGYLSLRDRLEALQRLPPPR